MATAIPEATGEEVTAEVVLYDPLPTDEEDSGDDEREPGRAQQLRFDVGGNPPDHNTLKLSADLSIEEPLRKGSEVRIQVIDCFGDHRDQLGQGAERQLQGRVLRRLHHRHRPDPHGEAVTSRLTHRPRAP